MKMSYRPKRCLCAFQKFVPKQGKKNWRILVFPSNLFRSGICKIIRNTEKMKAFLNFVLDWKFDLSFLFPLFRNPHPAEFSRYEKTKYSHLKRVSSSLRQSNQFWKIRILTFLKQIWEWESLCDPSWQIFLN